MRDRRPYRLIPSSRQAVTLLFAALFFLASPPHYSDAAADTSETDVTLEALIEGALSGNQQLVSAAAQAQRYNIRIPLVDSLTDPFLAFYYLDFPLGNISSGYTEPDNQAKAAAPTKVDIEAVRGAILTGRDMVENQALWYDYLSADLVLQVTGEVRENFYRLYYSDRIIAITEQSLMTLDNLIEASSASYAVGRVPQKDVLRAHVERYQLQAELIRLRQQRLATESTLNYLSARPMGKPLAPRLDPEFTHDSLPEMSLSVTDLISGLYQHRPLVKGYQALGGRFKAMRGMVQMYFNREVQTEAMYEADSGYRAIKAKGADFYNSTVSDLKTTAADLEKNRELAKLYGRVIVPQGRQSFEAGLADFKVGNESFLTLLKLLLDLNKDQTNYYRALADYMVDLTKLEKLSGIALN